MLQVCPAQALWFWCLRPINLQLYSGFFVFKSKGRVTWTSFSRYELNIWSSQAARLTPLCPCVILLFPQVCHWNSACSLIHLGKILIFPESSFLGWNMLRSSQRTRKRAGGRKISKSDAWHPLLIEGSWEPQSNCENCMWEAKMMGKTHQSMAFTSLLSFQKHLFSRDFIYKLFLGILKFRVRFLPFLPSKSWASFCFPVSSSF